MFHRVRRATSVMLSLFAVHFAVATAYRGQMVVWLLGGLAPFATMLLWSGIVEGGTIAGYDGRDFIAYFLSIYLVRQLTAVWVLFLVSQQILRGELSGHLLRPMPPMYQHVAEHLGQMSVRGPVVLSIFGIGALVSGVIDMIQIGNVFIFMISLILVWLIVFNMYYCCGLLAFWIGNAAAFDPLLWSVYTLLGGYLMPLDLLPPVAKAIVVRLPFAAALDFPAKLLMGKVAVGSIPLGLATQVFWVVALTLIRRWLWDRGLNRYSAAGA